LQEPRHLKQRYDIEAVACERERSWKETHGRVPNRELSDSPPLQDRYRRKHRNDLRNRACA
jgi:hypothetical protein